MKIPIWLLTIFVTAAVAFQGWIAQQVVELRADVAAIKSVLPLNTAQKDHELRPVELAHSDRP